MVTPSAGAVVLVPFPFSDLTQTKLRPALVLADAGRGDWILCQITSSSYGDPHAIPLLDAHFATGSLRTSSFVRPGKLFTANRALMVAEVGSLSTRWFAPIIDALIAILRSGTPTPGRSSRVP